MQIGHVVQYEAPSDPGPFARALELTYPKQEVVPWLKAVWEPGDVPMTRSARQKIPRSRWQVVERWVLYQMFPPWMVEPWQRWALEGPAPVTLRRWDPTANRGEGAIESDSLVSQRQWELYHETGGHFGRPFWVVQGTQGGHKVRFNKQESRLLGLHGKQHQPPDKGDLPYATVDRRTLAAVAQFDRLAQWNRARSFEQQTNGDKRVRENEEEQAFRKQMLGWLDRQIADAVHEVAGKVHYSELPDGDHRYDETEEQIEEQFVHGGDLLTV